MSVVIPALNEERNLPHVAARMPRDVDEIIFVDGRSGDGTALVAKQLWPDALHITQTRQGKGNALACGIAVSTGDIIVLIDADGSTDPSEIPLFVAALLAGADYAKGSRFIPGGGSSDITRVRRIGNWGLNKLVNVSFGARYTDLCYGYNAFWRRCLDSINLPNTEDSNPQWGDGFEIETLVNIRVAAHDLNIKEVPSFETNRLHGVSNLNAVRDGLRVLRTIRQEFVEQRPALTKPAAARRPQTCLQPVGSAPLPSSQVPMASLMRKDDAAGRQQSDPSIADHSGELSSRCSSMTRTRKRTPRVAMVSANALPYLGGVETHIDEVASRLVSQGIDVTVLTTDRAGDYPAYEERRGYRIRRWRAYPRRADFYLSPGLAQELSTSSFDLLHVQGVHTLVAPTALASARRAGIPSVLTFHSGGHSSAVRGILRPVHWRLLAPLFRSAAALIAVSEFERTAFAASCRMPPEQIELIRNGCDPLPVDPTYQPPTGRPLIVTVGRLERYKGHHRILQAMPEILAHEPEARLVIVGSGPYAQQLREMAEQLGVRERVSLCAFGPEQRGQLGKLIADADLMCLLSEYEANPVAVLEAVSAGTRTLVANTSGLAEFAEAGFSTALPVKAATEVIASTVLGAIAAPAPKPTAVTSWDECAERVLRLYKSVLQ